MNDPAIVIGSESRALVYFDEDSEGNLVDLIFFCPDCGRDDPEALPWPVFPFSTDYDTHCVECGIVINYC